MFVGVSTDLSVAVGDGVCVGVMVGVVAEVVVGVVVGVAVLMTAGRSPMQYSWRRLLHLFLESLYHRAVTWEIEPCTTSRVVVAELQSLQKSAGAPVARTPFGPLPVNVFPRERTPN